MTDPVIRSAMLVRPARPEDADALASLDRRVVEDGRGVVRTVDQATTAERFAADIDAHREPDGAFLVVEDGEGRVVGDGSVRRMSVAFGRHAAWLSIQVDPLAQGRGHGRALAEALVGWADGAGVSRLGLSVRADNDRAIRLYRSLGFAEEVRRRGFLRAPDGRWLDDLTMIRWNRPVDAEKAAAAIVRVGSGGAPELCVFAHPLAGWQLPKGTVEPGEAPELAVVREVEEETGLTGARVVAPLGAWIQVGSEVQRWFGFLVEPPADAPDRWDHVARGSPDEDGVVFALRWTPLASAVDALPPAFHELVLRARTAVLSPRPAATSAGPRSR